jgi:P27 family predicted phage terminase small subunit
VAMPERQAPVPAPPKGLLKSTVAVWDAFSVSQVSRAVDVDSDLGRLYRWIRAVDEYERALTAFQKNRLTTGSTGQLVVNPLAGYLRQLETVMMAAEGEFGMTPLSRLKLGLTAGQAQLTAHQLNRLLDEGEGRGEEERVEGWAPA